MAKKQRDLPAQPSPSSSSSEEEEEEELSPSSDEEQTNNSSIPHPKKAPIQNKNSQSVEESSDEEEDEDEDENPQPIKKPTSNSSIPHLKKPPIQTKIAESEEKSSYDEDENSQDDEKPQHVKKPTPSKPKSEKKMMDPSKPPIPNKSNGKSPIVRIWSIDDEIVILQAVLDHQSNNGHVELNAAGVKDLHDSIKKNLSIDIDTAKLAEKIRRMRKKYMGASKKGSNLKFANAHDKTIYNLSDKVWGEKEEEEKVGFVVNEGKSLKREFPFIRDALGGNKLALEMLETVDGKKAEALEENLKKLKAAELNVTWEVYKLLR